jgi:HlyD family secretion protein
MRRVLQNDQLVQQLSIGGAPIEVRLALTVDADTATGFKWSASQGPVGGVNAGTLLDGRVVVAERPLIDLVIPGFSTTMNDASEQGAQ